MGVIDEFTKTETAKLSWLDRFVGNYPRVVPTGFWVPEPPGKAPVKVIRIGIVPVVLHLIFVGFGAYFWWVLLWVFLLRAVPMGMGGGLLAFATFYVVANIRFLVLRKYNQSLRIGFDGITARGQLIPWDEIEDTAVMRRAVGRGQGVHLIVFPRRGRPVDLNLYMHGVSEYRLAKIVEGYKGSAHES